MDVTEMFKGATVATAQVDREEGIVAICVIHQDHPPAVFEMRIDKLYQLLYLCRKEPR